MKIYLSYSHRDAERARTLAVALTASGHQVWVDELQIRAGDSWQEKVYHMIAESSVVLVLWTPTSVQSEWVTAEARLAADAMKLIPVIISPVEIPMGFSMIQHVDLTTWNGDQADTNYMALVRAISNWPEGDRVSHAAAKVEAPGSPVIVSPDRKYSPNRRAQRTNLFIAHASADKPRLRPTVKILIDQGFRLWVDKPQAIGLDAHYEKRLMRNRIHFGEDWKESIRLAVKRADAVLAFWSEDAVLGRREQFHYEVYLAMMARKLNQCRIDKVKLDEIGMPYTFDHIADLSELEESHYNSELDYLMSDITTRSRSWW